MCNVCKSLGAVSQKELSLQILSLQILTIRDLNVSSYSIAILRRNCFVPTSLGGFSVEVHLGWRFWWDHCCFAIFPKIYINKRVRPKIGCSATPPKRVDVEKWLIQFWNPLLMAVSVGYVPFPEFFSTGNNSNYCSISGVFSVLGAPRKVIDTVLESSTHGNQS